MEVNSGEQLKNMMADRPKVEDRSQKFRYDHAAMASQFIKVINVLNVDPFVKKVVTLRLMSPIVTGRARSYVSIAIELGATERDVRSLLVNVTVDEKRNNGGN
jgi:hypothetical protein